MRDENIEDKGKVHALRWEIKKQEDLIKIEFLVEVPHPKGGKIIWTCVDDNIIEEKEENREIGLIGFNYTLF